MSSLESSDLSEGEPFLRGLVGSHRWLETVLSEHLADNDEVIPHVLMGDVTRAVVKAHLAGSEESRERVAAVVQDLDAEFGPPVPDDGKEPSVRGLIALSFLFNLPDPGEPGYDIRNKLDHTWRPSDPKTSGELETRRAYGKRLRLTLLHDDLASDVRLTVSAGRPYHPATNR